jgi:hypothetical protein
MTDPTIEAVRSHLVNMTPEQIADVLSHVQGMQMKVMQNGDRRFMYRVRKPIARQTMRRTPRRDLPKCCQV